VFANAEASTLGIIASPLKPKPEPLSTEQARATNGPGRQHACKGDYDSACQECQARWPAIMQERLDLARRSWESLRSPYRRILPRDLPISAWSDPPSPPDIEGLMPLVAAIYSPTHRALLREIFLDLIGDDLVDILLALSQERH